MVPLNLAILNTSLILRHSSDEEKTVIAREPFSGSE